MVSFVVNNYFLYHFPKKKYEMTTWFWVCFLQSLQAKCISWWILQPTLTAKLLKPSNQNWSSTSCFSATFSLKYLIFTMKFTEAITNIFLQGISDSKHWRKYGRLLREKRKSLEVKVRLLHILPGVHMKQRASFVFIERSVPVNKSKTFFFRQEWNKWINIKIVLALHLFTR